MCHLPLRLAILSAAALAAGSSVPAAAYDRDLAFFERVAGRWSGAGEIVAGKYKGTKFVCDFDGSAREDGVGMALDGGCRVGLFNQPMSASIERAQSGFRGTFMDGAAGNGLDVVGGVVKEQYAVFAIHRNELTGAMRAQLDGPDTMAVTISVHVEDELVPVIGVTLKRTEPSAVSSVRRD
jgi:hypothetical protein